ncbi:hypothetical protein SAMN05216233_101557 [Desulfoluna spongiiphila]|uniref:Uncharacterized protein n=1 Tax=Desulfoluna spongiiphila TaxID=419481 RepID=A0A1G5B0K1_9BACT|nr:hypothetical protein SAMN05216233_101557 [Desulfoluna spongiiphila]VVS92116.1 hypothetical protein DBB_16840 [Desulfoluna spongiiphila]
MRTGPVATNRCGRKKVKACDHNIKTTLELVEAMIQLAERGDSDREDSGCGILYGILRDAAYKIKQVAEMEREAHIRKGWWEEHP